MSYFADAQWHAVEVNISPTASGGAVVTFQLTAAAASSGLYHGFATLAAYELPSPAYLGFTARTGGSTNNHWVRAVSRETVWTTPPLPLPSPLLPVELHPTQFAIDGSASVDGDVLRLTTTEPSQVGTAFYNVGVIESDETGGFEFKVGFEMYVGGGTGADGMCVSIGGNDLA
jgi:hypothetical protein